MLSGTVIRPLAQCLPTACVLQGWIHSTAALRSGDQTDQWQLCTIALSIHAAYAHFKIFFI